jgi:hypothetical protein
MQENQNSTKFILPGHRIKILGTIIAGLLCFLVYSVMILDNEITISDYLLTPIFVFILIFFKKFLRKYSLIGFSIENQGLFALDGRLICKITEIENVNVSPYTFKSANGFIIHLKNKNSFDWVPGLFWKFNKRISIGGLISKSESKLLSQALTDSIAPHH